MILLCFGVAFVMILLIAPRRESLIAIKALKWLFSSMDPLMESKIRQTSEFSFAHLLISFKLYLYKFNIQNFSNYLKYSLNLVRNVFTSTLE